MKITVGIPSRGRHLELAASVLALDKTKSRAQAVEYLIGHDHNDPKTMEVVSQLVAMGLPIRSSFGPRPLGLGEIHNRLIHETDHDATFMLWSDRLVPAGMGWDQAIADTVLNYPTRVLWMDSLHLAGAGQFILPPMWRAALPGNACPAVFPYWHDDTWCEEVDLLVHGYPRVKTSVDAAGPRTDKTNRCWDIRFWIELFAALLPRRVEEARKISITLGIPPRDNTELIAAFTKRSQEFMGRADALAKQFGSAGVQDDTYIAARRQGERILAELTAQAA